MGEIAAIWIKRAHRGPMDAVDRAELVASRGVRGNADQGGRRQVTMIDEAAWKNACADVGVAVDPSKRRANVMLRGIDLQNSRGRLLRLGTAVVRIAGEVRPCERMEEAQRGLRAALGIDWRCGAFGEIVEGGEIHRGDMAEWIEEQMPLITSS